MNPYRCTSISSLAPWSAPRARRARRFKAWLFGTAARWKRRRRVRARFVLDLEQREVARWGPVRARIHAMAIREPFASAAMRRRFEAATDEQDRKLDEIRRNLDRRIDLDCDSFGSCPDPRCPRGDT